MGVDSCVQLRAVVLVASDAPPVDKISLSLMEKRQSLGSGKQKIVSFTAFCCTHKWSATQQTAIVSRARVSTKTLEWLRRLEKSQLVWVTARRHGRRHDIAVNLCDLLDGVGPGPSKGREATLNFTLTGARDREGLSFKACFGKVKRSGINYLVNQDLSRSLAWRGESQHSDEGAAIHDLAQPLPGGPETPALTSPRIQHESKELLDTSSAGEKRQLTQEAQPKLATAHSCTQNDLTDSRHHLPYQRRLGKHETGGSGRESHRSLPHIHTAPASLSHREDPTNDRRGSCQLTVLAGLGFLAKLGLLALSGFTAMYWLGLVGAKMRED